LKIKLNGIHFDTTEELEEASQAVLNTLTEQTSRKHLKLAKALGTVHTRGRGLLRGWWWLVGTKLIFDHMEAPVPEIMDGSLYMSPCATRPSME
jgi:hypothetical protein